MCVKVTRKEVSANCRNMHVELRSEVHTKFMSGNLGIGKGKAVPSQAWTGPEGSRKLKLPDLVTTAQDGGKVVSLTLRPP